MDTVFFKHADDAPVGFCPCLWTWTVLRIKDKTGEKTEKGIFGLPNIPD